MSKFTDTDKYKEVDEKFRKKFKSQNIMSDGSPLTNYVTAPEDKFLSFLHQELDRKEKEIGKEFVKWFYESYEVIEDAIFRITGVECSKNNVHTK